MKYTVNGFSQEKLVELKLDNTDSLILRYIVDFWNTGAMVKKIHNGKEYAWVKYSAIIKELPILKINNHDALRRRLKKIEEAGILEHYDCREDGRYSFYRLTEKLNELVSTLPTQKSDGPTQKSGPADSKVGTPSDSKVGTKYPNTRIDPSTRNSIKTQNEFKNEFKDEFKEYAPGVNLTVRQYNALVADYGESRVVQKIDAASSYFPRAKKTYKNHYRAIKNWLRKDAEKSTGLTFSPAKDYYEGNKL